MAPGQTRTGQWATNSNRIVAISVKRPRLDRPAGGRRLCGCYEGVERLNEDDDTQDKERRQGRRQNGYVFVLCVAVLRVQHFVDFVTFGN